MLMILAPTRRKAEAREEEKAVKAAKAEVRAANAAAEEAELAERRAAAHEAAQPKRKRGPADNMDPDIDL